MNLKTGRVTLDLNYRKVDDQLGLNLGEDEVINGRISWNQSFLNRAITHTFSYSTGNARELQREFIYLPVNTGDGTHTWRDVNEDGVQDLNEFFEEALETEDGKIRSGKHGNGRRYGKEEFGFNSLAGRTGPFETHQARQAEMQKNGATTDKKGKGGSGVI